MLAQPNGLTSTACAIYHPSDLTWPPVKLFNPDAGRAWQSRQLEGLRSKAFWGAEELPWMTDFEKGFHDVRDELLALRGRGGFQVLT